MGWNGKRLAICTDKNAVTAAVMSPVNAVLLRHGLKLSDLPVKRVSPYGVEQLCCRVYFEMILLATSRRKRFSVPYL